VSRWARRSNAPVLERGMSSADDGGAGSSWSSPVGDSGSETISLKIEQSPVAV